MTACPIARTRWLLRAYAPELPPVRVLWAPLEDRLGDALVLPHLVQIRYSGPLWGLLSARRRQEVIAHEIAHVLTWDPSAPHGPRWLACMRALGFPLARETIDFQ